MYICELVIESNLQCSYHSLVSFYFVSTSLSCCSNAWSIHSGTCDEGYRVCANKMQDLTNTRKSVFWDFSWYIASDGFTRKSCEHGASISYWNILYL